MPTSRLWGYLRGRVAHIKRHQQAMEKAEKEYRKYQVKTLSPVEQAYLDTIKQLEKEAKENSKNDDN